MSLASRKPQSKAENDANARTLRGLVKQPDNKLCADCKHNDTRWAAWNLGCFLCIRCSGIHRSMGTHISRVKSIDLDMWTREQMNVVIKWGNRRANLYWEAHLKPGHIPPDSRIESFIRSKYESRRWALKGPLPEDPSVLEGGGGAAAPAVASAPKPTPPAQAAPRNDALADLLGDDFGLPATAPVATPLASQARAAPAAPTAPASARGGGLFDLDWDEPAPVQPVQNGSRAPGIRKDDIMSLFSAPPPAPSGLFDSFATAQPEAQAQPSSATVETPFSASQTRAPSNLLVDSHPLGNSAAPQPNSALGTSTDLFHTQDVWGSGPAKPPANDAFADIWGEFK